MNALLAKDGYKADHRRQYPDGTVSVYSNWTPRGSRLEGVSEVILFGLQYFCQWFLQEYSAEHFFNLPKEEALRTYKDEMEMYLGEGALTYEHIGELHDLGYWPVEIKALPEGTRVPLRVPMFTIVNTRPEFFWVTNILETILSTTVWMPCNSATIAAEYRSLFERWAEKTGSKHDIIPDVLSNVDIQGHDFSMRGMPGLEAARMSGAAHLLSFNGTDTIPAIPFLRKYYDAEGVVGGSVPATEHSVMCMGSKDGEFETFKKLITETYPSGIISIVSDTWDLWEVVKPGGFLERLKPEILARDGKVVIRPDSGNPVDILCGTHKPEHGSYNKSPESKGVVELLWDIFGGTTNDKGYKELHPAIGCIYGDSITLQRAEDICERLEAKGFASTNWVAGIGSYTYQYNTRDTFGFAMKATYGEILIPNPPYMKGVDKIEGREIFKDPITDDGLKKSAKGLLRISKDLDGELYVEDQMTSEEEGQGLLHTVWKDGKFIVRQTLSEIRKRVRDESEVAAEVY